MNLSYGAPERVLVESEWYDGPRSGICYIQGKLHRFESDYDEEDDEWLGTFRILPVSESEAYLEIEQWRIFVDWNRRYEADEQTLKTHPATGGVHTRYDELQNELQDCREIPKDAQRAKAIFGRIERNERYADEGPDYTLRWALL